MPLEGKRVERALLTLPGDRKRFAGDLNGRAWQEGRTMEGYDGKTQGSALQTMIVKLALSFGVVLWMFLVATLSHA